MQATGNGFGCADCSVLFATYSWMLSDPHPPKKWMKMFFFHCCAFCRADTGVCVMWECTWACMFYCTYDWVRAPWQPCHPSPLDVWDPAGPAFTCRRWTLSLFTRRGSSNMEYYTLRGWRTGAAVRACVCVSLSAALACACVCFPEWYLSHVLVARNSVHFAEESNSPLHKSFPDRIFSTEVELWVHEQHSLTTPNSNTLPQQKDC